MTLARRYQSLAVQREAGVEQLATRVGRLIHSCVPAEFGAFLGEQQFVVVASQDQAARMWASLIVGGRGFVSVPDDGHVLLAGVPAPGDPLETALEKSSARIGVLAIEFPTRQRVRLNGVARRTGNGVALTVAQAYGNCSKYIQRRIPTARIEAAPAARHRQSTALDARRAAFVSGADTFFVASSHPERGADASHRGGRAGFVEVAADGRGLSFPDYAGHHMFQTLGNLTVNPSIGLLWLDWNNGSTLQVTGRARIVWDRRALESRPGAQRLIEVTIDAVREHDRAMPASWTLIEPYERNPAVRVS
ncbi:MAG TPA: pyridoxamine 5'-phosphate oxidase family protein [Streptosporangiaceae bacterium]|nr:pyridoxamine 5'-phosphate oxidase family protein [Streptosporangiaceae bacterium]